MQPCNHCLYSFNLQETTDASIKNWLYISCFYYFIILYGALLCMPKRHLLPPCKDRKGGSFPHCPRGSGVLIYNLLMLPIVCYLIFIVCYLLSIVCYLLFIVCYLLSKVSYLLFVVCYLLPMGRLLSIIYCLLTISCYQLFNGLFYVFYSLFSVIYSLLSVICSLFYVIYSLFHVIYSLFFVIYSLLTIVC